MIDRDALWFVIIGLGVGSFVFRYAFLGLVGSKTLPDWLLRHLRYTGVSVLPALIAPMVLWPAANGGQTDPVRLAAAAVTFAAAYWLKNVLVAMLGGALVLIGLPMLY